MLAEFVEVTQTVERRLSALLAEPIVQSVMSADGVDEKELFELLSRASANLQNRKP